MRRPALLAPVLLLPLVACVAADAGTPPPATGVVTGRLVYFGCDEPAVGLRLAIEGTPVAVVTDADGHFRVELAPGLWNGAIHGEGALPEQLVEELEVVAGVTSDEGEISVLPADLPETCPDGSLPGGGAPFGTPETDDPGAWSVDPTEWPDLPPTEPLDEDLPVDEEPLDPDDIDPDGDPGADDGAGGGTGSQGQELKASPSIGLRMRGTDSMDRASREETAPFFGFALRASGIPDLDIPPLANLPIAGWPQLADRDDPPEVVRLLADLEADTDEAAEGDLPISGEELPAGAPEPELAPAADGYGSLEQGLGRCPRVHTQRVTANGTSSFCTSSRPGISLDSYVKGVVYAEVSILGYYRTRSGRRLLDSPGKLEQMYRTFAVAARTYAVKRTGNARAIRVTSGPTFQCYRRGATSSTLDRAVRGTAGQVLAARSNGRMLTSEYAASCTLQVTRPENSSGYVGSGGYLRDRPRIGLYTSSGGRQHAHCGGHEGGGPCPGGSLDTTRNRRVRGICQTGAAERAMGGDSYEEILDHYQPAAHACPDDQDGRITPLSPKNVTKNDSFRIRFRFRDQAIESRNDDIEYVLTLRNRDDSRDTRRFHLYRRGEDRERWSAARRNGSFVVAWTPSENVMPVLRPRARYEWWVTRLADGDTARRTSPKVRFKTDEGRATIYVVRREGSEVGGERFDATLVVPPPAGESGNDRVGFIDRGMSDRYPFAVLDVPADGYKNGPLVFTMYRPEGQRRPSGTYELYVYDYRHPGGTEARDIARARTTVIVTRPCARGSRCRVATNVDKFSAPSGGYNYWNVFRMASDTLDPRAEGDTHYCDFRGETPTCVDAVP